MEEQSTTTTTPAQPEPLTVEAIASIVNTEINKFVASNKTDIAKMRDQVTSFKTELDGIRTAPAKSESQTTEANDPKLSVLERQLKELQEQNVAAIKKAEKADADTALNKVLSQFTFASERAREIAYKTFASDMAKIGDGEYAIGDQPLAEAVKATMADLSGLLAPKNVGGSGATSGKAPAVDVSQVKRGMSKDEMQAIGNELAKLF